MSIGGMIVLGKNWCRSSRKSCPSTILSTTKLSHCTTLLTTNHCWRESWCHHQIALQCTCTSVTWAELQWTRILTNLKTKMELKPLTLWKC